MMAEEEEPQFDNWKDAWEYKAGKTRDVFLTLSEAELLKMIKEDRTDMFYQVWYAIGEKGTRENAVPVLFQYLVDNPGDDYYLDRSHCSNALYKILGIREGKEPEEDVRMRSIIDNEGENTRQEALLELKKLIETKIGHEKF